MRQVVLRKWQERALDAWMAAGQRGIVSVVTGGGKTVFALACIAAAKPDTTLIVVPTIALLDQWWIEAAEYFGLRLDDINIVDSSGRLVKGTINLAVLNTAARVASELDLRPSLLIIDECHKAASEKFQAILRVPKLGTLGLSATPERQYDDGLTRLLIPHLGPVLCEYTYREALADGVIVPFLLRNVVFELESEREAEYTRLTKAIARAIGKFGSDSDQAVALMLRRSRVLNLSINRVIIALRIITAHAGERALIFHEDIEACEIIHAVLSERGVNVGVYHSQLPIRLRAEILGAFRAGTLDVLVTCRALDEGFNVPETRIGIIAASTATRRQRIQRLGRILRPSHGKERAIVYSLVATGPEVARLREEEVSLEGVADVEWSRG